MSPSPGPRQAPDWSLYDRFCSLTSRLNAGTAVSVSASYNSSKRERISKVAGRGPAVVDATGGGGPSRPTAPGGAANDPGAASSRGYLKTGPGGP